MKRTDNVEDERWGRKAQMGEMIEEKYGSLFAGLAAMPPEKKAGSDSRRFAWLNRELTSAGMNQDDLILDLFAAIVGVERQELAKLMISDFEIFNRLQAGRGSGLRHNTKDFYEAYCYAVNTYTGVNAEGGQYSLIQAVGRLYKQAKQGAPSVSDADLGSSANPISNAPKKLRFAYYKVVSIIKNHNCNGEEAIDRLDSLLAGQGKSRYLSLGNRRQLLFWLEHGSIDTLDKPLGEEDDETTLVDFVPDQQSDKGMREAESRETLKSAFRSLTELVGNSLADFDRIIGKEMKDRLQAYMTRLILEQLKLLNPEERKDDPDNRFNTAPFCDMELFSNSLYPCKSSVDALLHEDYLKRAVISRHPVKACQDNGGIQLVELTVEEPPERHHLEETAYYPLETDFSFQDRVIASVLGMTPGSYSKVQTKIQELLRQFGEYMNR